MEKWQEQLHGQDGFLRTNCFAMWLEFDIRAPHVNPGDPSVFIALTPQIKIKEVAEELVDYPEFQNAILRSEAILKQLIGSDVLALGHIGYMASRQKQNTVLPLRSCWRCNNVPHFLQLLELAGIPFDTFILQKQLGWLDSISESINSLMLDLESDVVFMPGFSLEINFYKPFAEATRKREDALFKKIVGMGFMTDAQRQALLEFSNTYFLKNEQRFICSLHHIKLKFSESKIQGIKCYWLASLKPRTW